MSQETSSEMNRREFISAAVAAAGVVGMACAFCPSAALGQATTQPATPAGPVDVGLKSSFDKDGPTVTFIKTNRLILMREEGKIYAIDNHCTHRMQAVQVLDDHLHCPAHNSDFKFDGTVIKGPAMQKGPLNRYAISVNSDGHVIVDTSKKITKDQWDDPSAFVSVA